MFKNLVLVCKITMPYSFESNHILWETSYTLAPTHDTTNKIFDNKTLNTSLMGVGKYVDGKYIHEKVNLEIPIINLEKNVDSYQLKFIEGEVLGGKQKARVYITFNINPD